MKQIHNNMTNHQKKKGEKFFIAEFHRREGYLVEVETHLDASVFEFALPNAGVHYKHLCHSYFRKPIMWLSVGSECKDGVQLLVVVQQFGDRVYVGVHFEVMATEVVQEGWFVRWIEDVVQPDWMILFQDQIRVWLGFACH